MPKASNLMTTKPANQMPLASNQIGRPITWAQVSLDAMNQLGDLMDRNTNAAKLLVRLMKHMHDAGPHGGVVVASRQTMTELLNCSMPTVERALRTLIKEGWVQRIKIGGAHALAINSQIAWTNNRNNLQFAVFSATVIASRKEQDAIALQPPPLRTLPIIGRDELALAIGPGQPDLAEIPPLIEGAE